MHRAFTVFLAFLVLTLTFGCHNRNLESSVGPEIKKIVIKAFPSFHNRSMFIIDVEKGDVIFDKLGYMLFLDEELNHDLVPFSYSFSKQEFAYLTDSIINQIEEVDFNDTDAPIMDGISTQILFVLNDNKVKKVHLSNHETTNQAKLIEFMFEIVIEECSDSSNVSYSRRILDYYN